MNLSHAIDRGVEFVGNDVLIHADALAIDETFRPQFWDKFHLAQSHADLTTVQAAACKWWAADLLTRLTSGEDVLITPTDIASSLGVS